MSYKIDASKTVIREQRVEIDARSLGIENDVDTAKVVIYFTDPNGRQITRTISIPAYLVSMARNDRSVY